MNLSVKEAAALLGKSPRTIRHQAQLGLLPASRIGNRWVFDREALIATEPAAVADRAEEAQRLRAHVNAAVDAVTPSAPKEGGDVRGFYSIRDVGAFKTASATLAAIEHADDRRLDRTAVALRQCLHRLADGFHQFQPPLKIERLLAARAACCAAIAELLHVATHGPMPEALGWADALERDALGSLRGLLRRAEKRQ
jgi:excisionase family DNA binding protein